MHISLFFVIFYERAKMLTTGHFKILLRLEFNLGVKDGL